MWDVMWTPWYRDLVEASIRITKQAMLEEKYSIADEIVEEKIIEAIIPGQEESCQQQESADRLTLSWETADI